MNKNLTLLLDKLNKNPDMLKKFSSQTSLKSLYNLSLSIKDGYSFEEFKHFLNEILQFYKSKKIPTDDLQSVAGGIKLLPSKMVSSVLLSGLLASAGGFAHSFEDNNNANLDNNSLNESLTSQNGNNERNRTLKRNVKNRTENNGSDEALKNLANDDGRLSEHNEANDNNFDKNKINDDEKNNSYNTSKISITSLPKASSITYGQKLSESSLSGGKANVEGVFSWVEPKTIPNAGKQEFSVKFTPSDKNLSTKIVKVNITVKKATAKIIKKPTASTITYGQTLSKSSIKGGNTGDISGYFTWANGDKRLNAGSYKQEVLFVPYESNNYEKTTLIVPVTVKQAPVSVEVYPSASSITFGQPLSASRISNLETNVDGTFDWISPSDKLSAGVHICPLIFRPFSSNYEPKILNVKVSVKKAIPNLVRHSFMQQYTPNKVVGDFPLPKGWRWQNPNMRLEGVGKFEATAIYDETANYTYRSETIFIEISKANPTPPSYSIVYNPHSQLKNINLPEGWHWLDENEVPSTSKGFYKARFNAEEAGTPFYNSKSEVLVPIAVSQATAHVSLWPTFPAPVVYGTDVSSMPLSGGISSVPGTFRLANNYLSLRAGDHICKVIFTPSDPNYALVEGTVSVKILKNMTPVAAPNIINTQNITRTDTYIDLGNINANNEFEFSIDGGRSWQSSTIFLNLSSNTKYYIIQRYKANDSRCAGLPSEPICISTKNSAPPAPELPRVKSYTNHKIELYLGDNLEYSIDGGNSWQASPIFDGLKSKTDYQIMVRIKETDDCMPSEPSKPITVTTRSFFGNIWNLFFGN